MVITVDDHPTTIGGVVQTHDRAWGLSHRHGSLRHKVIPTAPLHNTGVSGMVLPHPGLLQGKHLAIWGAGDPAEGLHPATWVILDIEQRSWSCGNLGQQGSRVG